MMAAAQVPGRTQTPVAAAALTEAGTSESEPSPLSGPAAMLAAAPSRLSRCTPMPPGWQFQCARAPCEARGPLVGFDRPGPAPRPLAPGRKASHAPADTGPRAAGCMSPRRLRCPGERAARASSRLGGRVHELEGAMPVARGPGPGPGQAAARAMPCAVACGLGPGIGPNAHLTRQRAFSSAHQPQALGALVA
jgi:hypothetical protein